jgi:hypothetical protein
MKLVLLMEFGGKGERISKDGQRDGVTRRWGEVQFQIANFKFQISN